MLVIDANIAIKMVVAEPGQDEVFLRLSSEAKLAAPDWVLVEVGHVLWRKAGMGEIDRAMAAESLAALPDLLDELVSAPRITQRAQALAFELDHWLYDCLYLATALELDAKLLTADRKFWNASKRVGLGGHVELLAWKDMPS